MCHARTRKRHVPGVPAVWVTQWKQRVKLTLAPLVPNFRALARSDGRGGMPPFAAEFGGNMHRLSDRIALNFEVERTSRSAGIGSDRRADLQVLPLVGRDAWQAYFSLLMATVRRLTFSWSGVLAS